MDDPAELLTALARDGFALVRGILAPADALAAGDALAHGGDPGDEAVWRLASARPVAALARSLLGDAADAGVAALGVASASHAEPPHRGHPDARVTLRIPLTATELPGGARLMLLPRCLDDASQAGIPPAEALTHRLHRVRGVAAAPGDVLVLAGGTLHWSYYQEAAGRFDLVVELTEAAPPALRLDALARLPRADRFALRRRSVG